MSSSHGSARQKEKHLSPNTCPSSDTTVIRQGTKESERVVTNQGKPFIRLTSSIPRYATEAIIYAAGARRLARGIESIGAGSIGRAIPANAE